MAYRELQDVELGGLDELDTLTGWVAAGCAMAWVTAFVWIYG